MKIGDIVRLKSGGPAMTVVGLPCAVMRRLQRFLRELCLANGFDRTIPATNPRATCAAMRRHRDKYHTNYKGKISYKAVRDARKK